MIPGIRHVHMSTNYRTGVKSIDPEAVTALRSIGNFRTAARKAGISRQVAKRAMLGAPLRPSTWRRIRVALGIASRLRCKLCGSPRPCLMEVILCCLYAPEPRGWCCQCGEDVPEGRVFCGHACSVEYNEDVRDVRRRA